MPDIAKLPELAELFHTTVDELLGEKSELVESAARGELEKYLEDNHISSEEICNAAPLLKPDQMTVVFESQKEVDLDEDMVDKLLIKAAEEGKYDKLHIMAPFAGEAAVTDAAYQLIEKGENITLIVPFISETDIDKISFMLYQRLGMNELKKLLLLSPMSS